MVTVIPQIKHMEKAVTTYFTHACLKSVISVVCSTVLRDLEHACQTLTFVMLEQ